jgi:hypothetical protein
MNWHTPPSQDPPSPPPPTPKANLAEVQPSSEASIASSSTATRIFCNTEAPSYACSQLRNVFKSHHTIIQRLMLQTFHTSISYMTSSTR